jgi:hypothetical protein
VRKRPVLIFEKLREQQMPVLEKLRSDLLPAQVKELWGLEEGEEVYLKVIRADEIAQIKQKIHEHTGLGHGEMEIAADLGLIARDQFWYWTPETQAQVLQAEADLKAGHYQTFESVDELLADLDDDQ